MFFILFIFYSICSTCRAIHLYVKVLFSWH